MEESQDHVRIGYLTAWKFRANAQQMKYDILLKSNRSSKILCLQASVERVLGVVRSLSLLTNAGSFTTNLVQVTKGRHLHFLPLTRNSVLQYCVQLVLSALQVCPHNAAYDF